VTVAPETAARTPAIRQRARLTLLGPFELSVGGEDIALALSAQRLVAFLALQRGALLRSFVAGSLWLDSTDARAAGSLRSALWRVNRAHPVVVAVGERLSLAPHVDVDVADAIDQAHCLLDPAETSCPSPRELRLVGDLLPDWYDDWVAVERERLRQLRAHALESLCARLTAAERFGEAVEAGVAATTIEPLRESAHRALVCAHLAEGNRNEALSQYQRFRRLLFDEVGLGPSERMEGLVSSFT